jgi:hypothetical protein
MGARPDVVELLEPGYGPLFDAALRVLHADPRVRALWLSGSLARGDADELSDLDLLVAVADDALADFAAGWRTWLAAITPTLVARPLPFLPGSLYAVTPGRERLDVVVEAVSALPTSPFRDRVVVFDREGLAAVVPPPAPGPGPSPQRVAGIVEEFFRDYGMYPVVVRRADVLLGIEAIHLVRTLLYQLFVEANAPLPPMGVKRWSAKLDGEQQRVLEALPTGGADLEEVTTAHELVAVAFVRHARRIATQVGVPWPTELEAATCRYLRSHGLPALERAGD